MTVLRGRVRDAHRQSRARSTHDLLIVGGGSAGLTAARVAAGLGARVTLVERGVQPGGDCLWTGCVPSKAFIAAARRAHDVRTAPRLGVEVMSCTVSFSRVMDHVRRAQGAVAPKDSLAELRRIGVETATGIATLHAGNRVVIDGEEGRREFAARHVLVATGSTPVVPPIPGIDRVRSVTTDDFWAMTELPGRLLVLGGGPVGCELGQACARLGSQVTIVETGDRLLAGEEPAASTAVERALHADGVRVLLGRKVDAFMAGEAVLDDGTRLAADLFLLAVGRAATAQHLVAGDHPGVELDDHGNILVDPFQRTSARRLWAAGDVTGQLPLANAAGLQGANAALNALLRSRHAFDALVVPRITFTDPEVGRVGLTAEEARRRFEDVEELVLPLGDVDRAVVMDRTEGEIRLVTQAGSRLLGATWIGDTAGEQLAHLGSVLGRRGSIAALATLPHGYPTLGQASRDTAFHRRLERASTPLARTLLRKLVPVLSRLS